MRGSCEWFAPRESRVTTHSCNLSREPFSFTKTILRPARCAVEGFCSSSNDGYSRLFRGQESRPADRERGTTAPTSYILVDANIRPEGDPADRDNKSLHSVNSDQEGHDALEVRPASTALAPPL